AFEAAIEVAVSLLDVLRRQAFRAAFLSVGEKTVFFPQINDRTGQEAIHRYFLQIQPAGRASFGETMSQNMSYVHSGAEVVIVTSRLDVSFVQMIDQMRQRSKRIIVLFIQSSKLIAQLERDIEQKLRHRGVVMNVITETELTGNRIDVRVS